jgi:4-amino-4-deoxy-L-arabinose transferase-like glycosyltransferase
VTSQPTTCRRQPRYVSPFDQQSWQLGYEAGRGEHVEHRGLVIAGVITAALVLLRRRLHPFVMLVIGIVAVAVFWPLLALLLGVEITRRQHRRFYDWTRTLLMAATWAVGIMLTLGVEFWHYPPWALILIPLAAIIWSVDRIRGSRQMRTAVADVQSVKRDDTAPVGKATEWPKA